MTQLRVNFPSLKNFLELKEMSPQIESAQYMLKKELILKALHLKDKKGKISEP